MLKRMFALSDQGSRDLNKGIAATRAATISARNRIFLNFFKAPLLTKRADWQ